MGNDIQTLLIPRSFVKRGARGELDFLSIINIGGIL